MVMMMTMMIVMMMTMMRMLLMMMGCPEGLGFRVGGVALGIRD